MNSKVVVELQQDCPNNSIWITWEKQRRNSELAKRFKATLYEWQEIDRMRSRVFKYAIGIVRTFVTIFKRRPMIVFCQNPSLVLSFIVCALGKLMNFKTIVDSHNAGLFPAEGKYRTLNKISQIIIQLSDVTIVTNDALKQHVEKSNGFAFVLPDPIPELMEAPPIQLEHPFNIFFICTFAIDEPYRAVFNAARTLDNSYHLYVSGDFHTAGIDPIELGENITLLGYLPEFDYVRMLKSVDLTIDLTERENCLVCGAYESIAALKPMILSDRRALRSYFNKGALFTDNKEKDIAETIKAARAEIRDLTQEIFESKMEKSLEWKQRELEFALLLRRL